MVDIPKVVNNVKQMSNSSGYLLWGYFIFTMLFSSGLLFAQPDTLNGKVFHEVEILHKDSILTVPQLQSTVSGALVTREEIERKRPDDLGEITRAFPGVFLRSYGGVGGLKTMNARGLGSQHFLVLTNGMPAMFHQNGSTNLGNIQADFIEAVKFSMGGADEWGIPVLAKTHGGVMQVFTTDYMFIPNRSKVEVSGLYGSFNRHKWSVNTSFSGKKYFVSANGYGMFFGGNYPFSYENGLTTIEDTRNNNSIQEGQIRLGGGIAFKPGQLLQAGVQYYRSDKVLPGAIVFYQPENFQTLLTSNLAGNIKYQLIRKRIKSQNYVNYGLQSTDYRNPFALGGESRERYEERTLDVSHSAGLELSKNSSVNWGVQYIYGALDGNTDAVKQPRRHRSLISAGMRWKPGKWIVRVDLPVQVLTERNHIDSNWRNTPVFTPSLGVNYRMVVKKSILAYRLSLGQSARVANFNELFFGQIGNTNLRPEKSRMFNLGMSWQSGMNRGFSAGIVADGFIGQISDKIVTIPTQNLFVWSVRNIGQVISYGFDASISVSKRSRNDRFGAQLIQKTSLNVSRDITDKNTATYGHQIPYTPYWNYSGELVADWKFLQLSYEVGYYDFRFVLGENIAANVLDEYWLHSIRLSGEIKMKRVRLRIYGKVNNLFDEQYQVMRSFPMPGRNYEIGLKMGWNGKS